MFNKIIIVINKTSYNYMIDKYRVVEQLKVSIIIGLTMSCKIIESKI